MQEPVGGGRGMAGSKQPEGTGLAVGLASSPELAMNSNFMAMNLAKHAPEMSLSFPFP